MILVDAALRARAASGQPVRVGMIGCGFMGRAVVNQIVNSVPGMRLVAVSNRHPEKAEAAFVAAGAPPPARVDSVGRLQDVIARGGSAVTDDPFLLCDSDGIDVLLEATGAVEFGARVALRAIAGRKHLILLNAELDGTVGPILKVHADRAGVILSGCDGDQPGVQMNLFRFVRGLGLEPLVCGNVKGLHDPRRNPATQQEFARRWGQSATMVTSFADGTKIAFEQAIVANATGMRVPQRGMYGRRHDGHVDELTTRYDVDALREAGGIVDYVVGARPGPGVFVLATHDDPQQRHYLALYKLGPGPLYCFYTPYHLCHFEVPTSLARAVLFRDAVLQPLAGPRVEVVATAKVDLAPGQKLDGLGGFCTYGLAEDAGIVARERLLPMGVAEDAVMRRAVPPDAVLSYDDVELPPDRVVDRLREEQRKHFGGA